MSNIEKGVEAMLDHMRNDYIGWSRSGGRDISEQILSDSEKRYCEGLEVTEGSRYWKIISDKRNSRSVCGFIVKAGDKKFREGDMLKPAGWAAPARNFARGNVLDGTGFDNVRWTGIG